MLSGSVLTAKFSQLRTFFFHLRTLEHTVPVPWSDDLHTALSLRRPQRMHHGRLHNKAQTTNSDVGLHTHLLGVERAPEHLIKNAMWTILDH